MKTTIELPDPLFRQVKVLAARRGTTFRELVVEGLQRVAATGPGLATPPFALTAEETAVAAMGAYGLPILKRPGNARRKKVTAALVDRLREELSL